ncbi:hypothetical protein [Ferrimonas balearica]|uniref:hypothetical protein n=1 Tax=Ferrimonas balearica TaxID=44012 RepID=UPI001C59CFD0|nr:hypothetical protein [Ferrimonas balearica]MBW3163953.1 hypothetical protein [Ferrimonas balearica]
MNKQRIALILITTLSGCGGGSDVPPPPPTGVVSGNAIDALIINGTVNAYDFTEGKKGQPVSVAPATTDDKGFFELSIQTGRDHPVLLEVTGGYYVEEASGKTISLNENQYLWSAINYERGTDIKTMVTTWTHLAAAEAWHQAEQGVSTAQAIEHANNAVSDWLGLDISTTYPVNITDPNYSSAGFYDGVKYGLQSAALSQWAYQLSEQAGIEPHTNFTSIVISNIMVNDIQSDGRLDGIIDGARIMLGPVTLSNETYRTNLARSALHVVNRDDINQINVSVSDTVPYVQHVAAATPDIFGGTGSITVTNTGPVSTPAQTANTLISGTSTVTATVSDYIGVSTVELWANGTQLDRTEFDRGHTQEVAFSFDSETFPDGVLAMELRATNTLGVESVTPLSVVVANNDIAVDFLSSELTRFPTHVVRGEVVNVKPPLTVSIAGEEHSVNGNEFTVEVELSEGVNVLPLLITDSEGKGAQFEHTVRVDMTPPKITWDTPTRALTYDGNEVKQVSFPLNGNVPLYIQYDNARLGTMPATRAALEGAQIPYLVAELEDAGAVHSSEAELSATFSLLIDGQEQIRRQSLQRNSEGEWMLPLALELIPGLFEIEPDSSVSVSVTAIDLAGNEREASFPLSFYVDLPTMLVDSTFIESTLALSRYHAPTVGTLVKDCDTNSSGDCALRLYSAYPLLYLSATGGEYQDPDGQRFEVEVPFATLTDFYEEDKTVYFTPLSAVLIGLYQYELNEGQAQPAQALQRARSRLVELYGFDPLNTPIGNLTGELGNPNRHALLLGAYSTLYNSLSLESPLQLLRAMQDDVAADGYLDGKGTEGDIELGNQVISAEFWRQDVAEAINSYHANLGKPLGNTEVGQWAQQVSLNTESIFRATDTPEGWDKQPPQLVSAAKMNQWVTDEIVFPVEASDDTGIALLALTVTDTEIGEQYNGTTAEFAMDTTDFDEGENAVSIEIVDEVANSVTATGKLYIDNSDPVIAEASQNGQWQSGEVEWYAPIEEVSPYTNTVTIDGTKLDDFTTDRVTIDTTELTDGSHQLVYQVTDSVSNNKNRSFTLKADNTAPAIADWAGADAWYRRDFSFATTVSDISLQASTLTLNTTKLADFTNRISRTIDVDALSNGTHTLKVEAQDAIPHSAERSWQFKVDKTAPTLSSSSGWDQRVNDVSSVTVAGTVSDAHSGVSRVTVDGQNATLSGNRWTRTISVVDGRYSWTVVAYDQAGNAASNTENVVVTSTPRNKMRMTISGGGQSLSTNTLVGSYTLSGVRAESLTSPVSLTLTTQFLDCAGNGTCTVTWSGTGVTQQGNNAVISRELDPLQSTTGTATATFVDSINNHRVTVRVVNWTLERTGECTPGQTQNNILTNCGALNTHQTGLSQRTCQANGLWGRWGVIRDPVCSPNPIP